MRWLLKRLIAYTVWAQRVAAGHGFRAEWAELWQLEQTFRRQLRGWDQRVSAARRPGR